MAGLIYQNQKIVSGSILGNALSNNISFAESFLDCEAVIMCDVSASMSARDAGKEGMLSRFEAMNIELEKLQNSLPGKLAVCSFSMSAKFCPAGLPKNTESLTDMVKALEFMKDFDDAGIKLILISDGEPDDEYSTLRIAQGFKSKIDTIFVGSEMSAGRDFLRRLAEATGGISIVQETEKLNFLSENVRLLLGT